MEKKVITPKEILDQSMVNIFGHDINIYAIILLGMFAIFLIALWRAQRAKRLDWMDMITRDGTKVSTTKILQLVGGIVGTWIIIQVTLQGVLTWDLFAIYLAYVASIDGFSKLILARYGAQGSDDSREPYRKWTGNPYNPGNPGNRPNQSGADDNHEKGAAKAYLD